jgi:hypothetical protein
MAFADRVMETTTSTGTGNLTTAGAVAGYRTCNAAFGTNVSFEACIEAVDGSGVPTGDWEVSVCHLSASTTLVRGLLLSSSTGSAVNFSAGTKRIFNVYPANEVRTTGNAYAMSRGLDLQ